MLWNLVLPSMPKREIVGYNCLIVCCFWCHTNVISKYLPSSVGQQGEFQCLPSIPRHHSSQTVFTKLTRASKVKVAKSSAYWAFIVNKGKLVFTEFTWSPRDFAKFAVVIELQSVNKGNHFRIGVYQAGSTNEGFC